MQAAAIVVALGVTLVAIALVARAVSSILATLKLGQPTLPGRTADLPARTVTMLRETVGHTRMLQWTLIGAAHWFVFVGFGALFLTLVTAFGQLFDAHFALPLIGHWWPYEALMETVAVLTGLGILTLIVVRQKSHPRRPERRSRFAGSTFWQAYYVEGTIVAIVTCVLTLRALEGALLGRDDGWSLHHPFTYPLVVAFANLSQTTLENAIYVVAAIKIVTSFLWFAVIALNLTMGVAWHRFAVFPNVFFKRNADGRPSLGALPPLAVRGKPIDLEAVEELEEDDPLGVGKVEDFTWKGLLDFTTCTECGRCQSQCPAWNTGKPLSPKLLIMGLRDHAYAKAPYLLAGSDEAREALPETTRAEAERPLVGDLAAGGVIDPDVLWSCTTCGACVQQCPVDIEHVDHIVDMRRYQVLIESSFPTQLNGLFKNLERSGNPWGVNASKRMEWAESLPFEVKQVGADIEDLTEVEWLYWVGCAGAFDDRAKRTIQAVAELLHLAGVSYAVLGDGESCTGDPARRSGNEFLFQQMAMQNAEVLTETKATKVVTTCAHCFNTLKNEYGDFGVDLQVVHHTQLLNSLVREGKLTPVAPLPGSVGNHTVTYHDPCYIGRHNKVYSPPRELLQATGLRLREMPRHEERSFCCGAGGARMWMEERIGKRINSERSEEAVSTGAGTVATGCPFCRIMLTDGVTAAQTDGIAGEDVTVQDVAQLLLAAVKRGQPGAGGPGDPDRETVDA